MLLFKNKQTMKTLKNTIIALLAIAILAGYSSIASAHNKKGHDHPHEPYDPSKKRYRVGGILGAGFIIRDLQDFLPEESNTGRRSGNAFTFDWFGGSERQHSFALELHGINYNSRSNNPIRNQVRTEVSSLNSVYLGYRYHTPSGFYVGVGAFPINNFNTVVLTETDGDEDGDEDDNDEFISLSVRETPATTGIPIGFNLGYVKTYNSGFSVGINAIQSSSVGLDNKGDRSIESDTLAIRTVGVVFAYTHTNR